MGHNDRHEIFERLEALERMIRRDDRGSWEHDRHGGHDDRERCDHDRDRHHHDDDRRGGDFDEKRIIDTIVHLVSEQVGRLVEDQQARSQPQNDGGGEKRIVDLIVGLVSEHVKEIVSTELDRRFGRADAARAEVPPPSPPSPPAGGSPKREQS